MAGSRLKQWLVGTPLSNIAERHQRLSKTVGLAVFSSDALSSVAYATEEILLVLILAGAVALGWSLPIGLAIIGLLVIVSTSYWQTIQAYPSGGGSYIVARENLGTLPSLTAAAALLIDYVLTVAVSVAAGVAALTSAVPALREYRVAIGVLAIAIITAANLRGVKESGKIFAVPTYGFITCMGLLILWGSAQLVVTGAASASPAMAPEATHPLSIFLLLRAFSSGCTALTGVEAISDGVPAFKPPESRNAGLTLVAMTLILGTLFAGITFLAHAHSVVPAHDQTVVSQIARHVFGGGVVYYLIQAFTALILFVAANTAYADFPRLASFLARDRFVPRQLANRGDRLVFSNGVLTLGVLAAMLLAVFGGETHALIPLYAVGVFLSFTISQSGMVARWRRGREPGWRRQLGINATGAVATGVVAVIIGATKFTHGAWIVVLLIPILILAFLRIRAHYDVVVRELSLEGYEPGPPVPPRIIVPVGGVHRATVRAVEYARTLNEHVTAVYIDQYGDANRVLEQWGLWGRGTPIVVLTSPYRSMVRPLLDYIDRVREAQGRKGFVTVVLPEFMPRRWWQHFLHNQSALLLKGALLFRRDVVVVNVPFHLQD
jgi:amino acid transporter